MRIIDPRKVDSIREVFDADVAEIALSLECTREFAYEELALREFETHIQPRLNLYTGWWMCLVIEGSAYYAFHGPEQRVAGGYMTPREAAIWKLQSTIFARDPEVAMIGALGVLLNPDADLSMDPAEFRKFYGEHAMFEIVDSLGGCCRPPEAEMQPLLFDLSLEDKLADASASICHATRPLLDAWVRL